MHDHHFLCVRSGYPKRYTWASCVFFFFFFVVVVVCVFLGYFSCVFGLFAPSSGFLCVVFVFSQLFSNRTASVHQKHHLKWVNPHTDWKTNNIESNEKKAVVKFVRLLKSNACVCGGNVQSISKHNSALSVAIPNKCRFKIHTSSQSQSHGHGRSHHLSSRAQHDKRKIYLNFPPKMWWRKTQLLHVCEPKSNSVRVEKRSECALLDLILVVCALDGFYTHFHRSAREWSDISSAILYTLAGPKNVSHVTQLCLSCCPIIPVLNLFTAAHVCVCVRFSCLVLFDSACVFFVRLLARLSFAGDVFVFLPFGRLDRYFFFFW